MATRMPRLMPRWLRGRAAVMTLCAAAASSTALATTRLEAASASPDPETSATAAAEADEQAAPVATPSVEFLGVFLTPQAADKLRARFPSKQHAASSADAKESLYVVLRFHPTEQDRTNMAPLMGRRAMVHVRGYVEDEHTQAVLVDVKTESGDVLASMRQEPDECDDCNRDTPRRIVPVPHVRLSSLDGAADWNDARSSVLLERLAASGQLEWLQQEASKKDAMPDEWRRELPRFESALLPMFNPFPAVLARVRPIFPRPAKAAGGDKDDEDVLEGTICLASAYDAASGSCVAPKGECGFCTFMKAGPCGAEFTAWEDCLDRCKQAGLDFIEHCGRETLALRDCVDANPEYYHILNEAPEDEDAEDAKATGQDKRSD